MTRLSWNDVGERLYETGIDRGVLYPQSSGVGVVWNGLISVRESPVGGEAKPHYMDGVKYLNLASTEEFEASISAYTYPDEFAECDGTAQLYTGISVSQQPRTPFDLCYRTVIGNDIRNLSYGYKLHLIYNALASPSSKTYSTIDDSTDPLNFSWNITTTPVEFPLYFPSSHFIVDSTKAVGDVLSDLEDILYGTDSELPRMLTLDELLFLFNDNPDDFISTFGGSF
jgi:hypothetical protein